MDIVYKSIDTLDLFLLNLYKSKLLIFSKS